MIAPVAHEVLLWVELRKRKTRGGGWRTIFSPPSAMIAALLRDTRWLPFFPKASDLVMKVGGLVLGLGMLTGVGAYVYFSYPTVIDTGYQPMQPVPYSHKLHVGQLGLDCFYCHSTVYKAAYAAIPATETCMNWPHAGEGQESAPELVRQSYATGKPVPW